MMPFSPLTPNFKERSAIEASTHAGFYKCWTCGTCDGGCPVNIVTGSLRPQKIVRLAYIGMLEELLHLPEIWYCLTCRRCGLICPNLVKPCDIIAYVRQEMIRRDIVTMDAVHRYQTLFAKFQRVRWHAVDCCMKGSLTDITDGQWNEWLNRPVRVVSKLIENNGVPIPRSLREAAGKMNPNACFTCSECSSACPVFCERDLFDPQAIIRMVNLGLVEELLLSPSIWLCLGCERCTNTCSQLVRGHQVIKSLQNLAISKGAVDMFFVSRLEKAEKVIFPRFFAEIDSIFNLDGTATRH
jgi:heterodisulfide reductase subunit C